MIAKIISAIKKLPNIVYSEALDNRDVGNFVPREVLGVIYPVSVDGVQELIELFNELKSTIPLHPISTGMNWGFGSSKAPIGPYFILNLSKLNNIYEIDFDNGFAHIESGVTQGQVSNMLKNSDYYLNVVSASSKVSIIGNALEKGMGYTRAKIEDIKGLEVVTGAGQKVKVGGFWHEEHNLCKALSYPYGVGPNLLHSFFQSSYGVVTSGVISLLPRPEKFCLIKVLVPEKQINAILKVVNILHQKNIVQSYFKLFSVQSGQTYFQSSNIPKNCQYILYGDIKSSTALYHYIKEEVFRLFKLHGFSKISFVEQCPSNVASIDQIEELIYSMYIGETRMDSFTNSIFNTKEEKFIDSNGKFGWLMLMFTLPKNNYQLFDTVIKLLARIKNNKTTQIGETIKMAHNNYIDVVVRFKYECNEQNIKNAHNIKRLLAKQLTNIGCYLYRLDCDQKVNTQDIYYNLKKHFDPNGVLILGKYI